MGIRDILPWTRNTQVVPQGQKMDYTEAVLLPLQLSLPSSRTYREAVMESYQANSIAHRAIRLIAENTAAVPWILVDRRTDEPVEEHWVIDSLRKPNPGQSGRLFKQVLAGDMIAAGEVFILRIQPNLEMPAELHLLRPDYVRVRQGERVGDEPMYEYRPPGRDPQMYRPSEVLHIHTLDLLRTGRGFSSIYAAASELDQSNLGGRWNVSLLRNGGRPSLAVIAKHRLNDEQKQMLRSSVNELHAGAANAGKVAVFSGTDMEIRDLGFSPSDMDWLEGLREADAKIATALGVPPELLNLGQRTYENKKEARKGLYEDVVVPMFGMTTESLNAWIVPEELELRPNWEQVEALQPNRTEEYRRLNEAVAAGWMTFNDARREAGFEEDTEVGDLYRWQADAVSRFGAVPSSGRGRSNGSTASRHEPLRTKVVLETEEQKATYWKAQDDRKQAFEGSLSENLKEVFDEERKRVVSALRTAAPSETLDVLKDRINSEIHDTAFRDVMEPTFIAVMEDFGEKTLEELGLKSYETKQFEEIFGSYTAEVLSFVGEEVASSVTNITRTQKDIIALKVARSIDEGMAIPKIADAIDDMYLEQIIPNRSTVIARTEVIKSSNAGQHTAAQATGLPVVRDWLATRDGRARQAHLDAERNPANKGVPLDGTFEVGGENLRFPGDPMGSPGNIIQCRCTVVQRIRGPDE